MSIPLGMSCAMLAVCGLRRVAIPRGSRGEGKKEAEKDTAVRPKKIKAD